MKDLQLPPTSTTQHSTITKKQEELIESEEFSRFLQGSSRDFWAKEFEHGFDSELQNLEDAEMAYWDQNATRPDWDWEKVFSSTLNESSTNNNSQQRLAAILDHLRKSK